MGIFEVKSKSKFKCEAMFWPSTRPLITPVQALSYFVLTSPTY